MDDNDETVVLCAVKEHFSKATDEDGRLIWNGVRRYALDDAKHAIREHRLEKGANAWRPDVRRVLSLAAARTKQGTRDVGENEPVHWTIARQRPDLGGDAGERVVAYFGEAWAHALKTVPDPTLQSVARAAIYNHCLRALEGAKVPDAVKLARETVGLKPGERIRRPWSQTAWHKVELPDTRPWPAIKKLAVAEHGGAKEPSA